MKRFFSSVVFFFFSFTITIPLVFGDSAFPPVDLDIFYQETGSSGNEVEIFFEITPREDLHLDISCVIPEGVEPELTKELYLRSYRPELPFENFKERMKYKNAVTMHAGPVKAGEMMSFSFKVRIDPSRENTFILQAKSVTQSGMQEKLLTIGGEA
jgi:hypothetical protein